MSYKGSKLFFLVLRTLHLAKNVSMISICLAGKSYVASAGIPLMIWIWPEGGLGRVKMPSSDLFSKWGGKMQEKRWRMEVGMGEKCNKKTRWGCLFHQREAPLFYPSQPPDAKSPPKTCLNFFGGRHFDLWAEFSADTFQISIPASFSIWARLSARYVLGSLEIWI